jgi:light-independent protochlorophyllide reductase subunit B
MIQRNGQRPPVTYTTFQARDLGADTAAIVLKTARETVDRFKPGVLLVAESCTAELLQDQPGSLTASAGLEVPLVHVELSAYSRKENWGASETFYHLVRGLLGRSSKESVSRDPEQRPSVNLLGPTTLGFRCRDDVPEITKLLDSIGVDVNVVAPAGAAAADLLRIPQADANVCLYPETAQTACTWLERQFKQPIIRTVPIGIGATRDFIAEVAAATGIEVDTDALSQASRMPWYSRSVDSTYLTGKRVYVYGDATHAVAAARIANEEMGFEVVGLGTYSRENAKVVRQAAEQLGITPLISEDYLEVERQITELRPEMVLGTQMERHIAKKLGIGCAVISAPAHVQDFPARYSPQMGYEGANVIFDTWVHPLMMGLEEHLLGMFREDFEFNDEAAPSHLASVSAEAFTPPVNSPTISESELIIENQPIWAQDAEKELKKIPFFVRGKARRNTELFAVEQGIATISIETLYEAKAHYSR